MLANQSDPKHDKNFGTRVIDRRKQLGVPTQGELASAVGQSRNTVSAWERGQIPHENNLQRLAAILCTTREHLLYGTGEAEAPISHRTLRGRIRKLMLDDRLSVRDLVYALSMEPAQIPTILKWLGGIVEPDESQLNKLSVVSGKPVEWIKEGDQAVEASTDELDDLAFVMELMRNTQSLRKMDPKNEANLLRDWTRFIQSQDLETNKSKLVFLITKTCGMKADF